MAEVQYNEEDQFDDVKEEYTKTTRERKPAPTTSPYSSDELERLLASLGEGGVPASSSDSRSSDSRSSDSRSDTRSSSIPFDSRRATPSYGPPVTFGSISLSSAGIGSPYQEEYEGSGQDEHEDLDEQDATQEEVDLPLKELEATFNARLGDLDTSVATLDDALEDVKDTTNAIATQVHEIRDELNEVKKAAKKASDLAHGACVGIGLVLQLLVYQIESLPLEPTISVFHAKKDRAELLQQARHGILILSSVGDECTDDSHGPLSSSESGPTSSRPAAGT